MDGAKVLHITGNADVKHAAVQLIIIDNLSFWRVAVNKKSASTDATISYYCYFFVLCDSSVFQAEAKRGQRNFDDRFD
uniref:Uncharacterized protein n=1 Tax=Romanomermis culicivorax TaxID=13658 RepID=A0A915JCD6_ROMCU